MKKLATITLLLLMIVSCDKRCDEKKEQIHLYYAELFDRYAEQDNPNPEQFDLLMREYQNRLSTACD